MNKSMVNERTLSTNILFGLVKVSLVNHILIYILFSLLTIAMDFTF